MIIIGPDFPCYLVALTGCHLATIEIDLPVFGEITHYMMICGRDDFHAMQSYASQYGIE